MMGHCLYAEYLKNPKLLNTKFHIDPGSFCTHRGITRQQFTAAEIVLCSLGLAKFCGHSENEDGDDYIWLTPDGVRWAVSGFDTGNKQVNNFAFEFNISIDTSGLLRDLVKADIDPDVKVEAIEVTQEIKNEPTIEKVGRLVELAANTQQLLPTVIKFIADNAAAMSQLAHHIPS